MELRCQVDMNWYEVGKETPREGILLFMVTDKEPDLIYSGYYIQGSFRILGQLGGILMLKDSNVTHFAYMNNNMLPKNCKEYSEAHRLLKFLHYFVPVSDKEIPLNSLMRGFIGGGSF